MAYHHQHTPPAPPYGIPPPPQAYHHQHTPPAPPYNPMPPPQVYHHQYTPPAPPYNPPPQAYHHQHTPPAPPYNPPPYSIEYYPQASTPFPSTGQYSNQGELFHFPTDPAPQCNPAPAPQHYASNPNPPPYSIEYYLQCNPAPYPGPALRGNTRRRPRQRTIPYSVVPKERKIEVYVGKLAMTVEDDFIVSLLELCGPVKNWKRSENPTTGTPNPYGMCEFESVVGVLRALRLLSKLNVDGQELKIEVTADERKYLEVEKSKSSNTDEDREADQKALESLTRMIEERLKNSPVLPPPSLLPAHAFGYSNSEKPARSRDGDSDVDMTRNAEDKNDDEMTSDSKPTSEHDKPETSSTDRSRGHDRRSKKGGRKEKERQLERYEIERMQDRPRRERERDYKIEEDDHMYEACDKRRKRPQKKERECTDRQKEYSRRLEKEGNKVKGYKCRWEVMEQEDDIDGSGLKRTEHKSSGSKERRRLEKKLSESTESQNKYLQKLKKEEKKEKYRGKREGMKQEDDIDGGDLERKHKSSSSKERRRKLRDKEEDSEDRLEEVAENPDAGKDRSMRSHDRSSRRVRGQNDDETNRTRDEGRKDNYARSGVREQGADKAKPLDSQKLLDAKRISSASKEEKSDAGKDRSRRSRDRSSPRVTGPNEGRKDHYAQSGVREQGVDKAKPPCNEKLLDANRISSASKEEKFDPGKDRSTHSHDRSSRRVRGRNDNETNHTRDERRKDNYARSGVREQGSDKDKPPDKQKLFDAKRISSVSHEEKSDVGKDRSKRSHDRSSPRVTGQNDGETNRGRDEGMKDNYARSGVREQGFDKAKTPDNQKLLDLIDLIPTTKDKVFSYKINWAVYDKSKLHDQMRTRICKMIEKFLGEEDTSLLDFIVSSMREHVEASKMLKQILSILDVEVEVEVEMFVVKIWRLLIFEIMKIETPDLSNT